MGVKFNPFTGFLDLTGNSSGGGGGTITGVVPTNSINFSVSGGNSVTGDVKLSSGSADANNKLVTLSIETDGLKAQIPDSLIQSSSLNLQGPITLTNNTTGTAFTYTAASYPFSFIKYSILRNGAYRCGTLLVTSDGTTAVMADNGYTELGTTGVTFFASISGPNVQLQYITTNTGSPATFKYSISQWS
jgi:hypothetical protein